MRITITPLELRTKHEFKIARGGNSSWEHLVVALDPPGCHSVGRYRYGLILRLIREAICPSSIRVQRLKRPMMIPISGSRKSKANARLISSTGKAG